MKHLHSGPLDVNRDPDAAPAAERGARFAQDRAAVVTTAILQIGRDCTVSPPTWRARATHAAVVIGQVSDHMPPACVV
jgi:hypothetical protein